MALVAVDQALVERCLNREPGAWNDFVDRYLGLIYHTIYYTAHLRSVVLRPEDVEDIAAEILLQVVANDYAVLRRFLGKCSLATYLTVVARRICVHELAKHSAAARIKNIGDGRDIREPHTAPQFERGLENVELVQRMLKRLPRKAREIVRLYFLEGRSYEEISTTLHVPVNSIGPVLSRAKKAMQNYVQASRQRRSDEDSPSEPSSGPDSKLSPARSSPKP